jgi:hypothetical protein
MEFAAFCYFGSVRMLLTEQAHAVVRLNGDRVCISSCNWLLSLLSIACKLSTGPSRSLSVATLSNWVASIQWNSGATNHVFPICFQGPRFSSASPPVFVFLALLHLYLSVCGISKDTSVGLCTWQLYAGGHGLGSSDSWSVLFTLVYFYRVVLRCPRPRSLIIKT